MHQHNPGSLSQDQQDLIRFYQDTIEQAPIGIFTVTPDGRYLTANTTLARMHGFNTSEELITEVNDIASQVYVYPEEREEFKRVLESRGEVKNYESLFRRPDGSMFWVSRNVRAVRDEKGDVIYYQGFVTDITAKKDAEVRLQERVKEQQCLYQISSAFKKDTTLDTFLQQAVEAIPPGWQYPEDTAARITFGGKVFSTPGFQETPWQMSVEFTTGAQTLGDITVAYLQEKPRADHGPFLQEEWRLLHAIARHLGGITGRVLAEQEINRKNEQLQQLLDEKDRFFSIIAHDLRSPLTGVMGFTRMLAEEVDQFSQQDLREVAEEMHKATENLQDLLENLLQWASIQKGAIECEPEDVSLAGAADKSIRMVKTPAGNKDISIESEVDSGLMVYADRRMLDTVIRNLLSNAVKFTPAGGRIRISAEIENSECSVHVEDTGTGMDEQTLSGLFVLDRTTSRKGTGGEKGTGLGLLLCKEFVEMQGGKIRVNSTPGKGSTFSFTVPLA
ncbi:PAS/PAC sensor signal transduction histidine kinase [Desulfonatronospira thiodismutans ASO3-1]|uniref:histidine kinase n=1 Tax=Desulfonatronospira thiodismutans ASO3-1 TaxID=555779 RepID=D6SPH0_9BACT|nr:PAS domain-containing sensor histidine kinase [Desulfonatronospira thiodismutans]EFI34646.1 PAS/PAC sensor signal transduction histidine kinase [Desulfonatronospira thiodismutans ASO3-1]